MSITVSNSIKLDRVIAVLEATGHPTFAIDLNKDELNGLNSFIVYNDKGDIERSTQPMQYLRDFTVLYVSKVNEDIDEVSLINQLMPLGLVFVNSTREEAKFQETDQTALVVTLNFKTILRMCR